MNYAEIKASV